MSTQTTQGGEQTPEIQTLQTLRPTEEGVATTPTPSPSATSSPPSPPSTPPVAPVTTEQTTGTAPPTTTAVATPSFWNSYKKPIGIGLVILVLGLLFFWWWRSRQNVSTTGSSSSGNDAWKKETRTIFPLNTTVTIQSQESGKFLRFVESNKAQPNQPLPSQAGLILEASGEGSQDNACRWIVRDILPTQPADYQGTSVRLENVQFETYLRAIALPNRPNIIAYQAGTGARSGSPMWAVKADSSNAVIISGASVFESLSPRPEKLTPDNPVGLQCDAKGIIIPLPHSPTGNSSRWLVNVVLQ